MHGKEKLRWRETQEADIAESLANPPKSRDTTFITISVLCQSDEDNFASGSIIKIFRDLLEEIGYCLCDRRIFCMTYYHAFLVEEEVFWIKGEMKSKKFKIHFW